MHRKLTSINRTLRHRENGHRAGTGYEHKATKLLTVAVIYWIFVIKSSLFSSSERAAPASTNEKREPATFKPTLVPVAPRVETEKKRTETEATKKYAIFFHFDLSQELPSLHLEIVTLQLKLLALVTFREILLGVQAT